MIKHCLGISEINSIQSRKHWKKTSPFQLTQSIKVHRRALVLLPCLTLCLRSENWLATLIIFGYATWQHMRENARHVRGTARIYDVRMVQFVLKVEQLSHIMGPHGSQDLRSPSPIMDPAFYSFYFIFDLSRYAWTYVLTGGYAPVSLNTMI